MADKELKIPKFVYKEEKSKTSKKKVHKKSKSKKKLSSVKKKVATKPKFKKLKLELPKKTKKLKKERPKLIKEKKHAKLQLKDEEDVAMDFAIKVYEKFNKIVKSVVLFGSTAKHSKTVGSDIDIMIIIDDASINWDQKLIAWYRAELNEIIKDNPYKRSLHINTIKLSTWWRDLLRGDPTIINIIRYGKPMIDLAGFFEPLKFLLAKGDIKPSPEAIYNCLQRAPIHFHRSKIAELSAIEGLYWAMVDSAHAALIAANVSPPSPEHIAINLKETFVDAKKLKMVYVKNFRDLHVLHKEISHKKITDLKGVEIDDWQEKTKDFMNNMAKLVKDLV